MLPVPDVAEGWGCCYVGDDLLKKMRGLRGPRIAWMGWMMPTGRLLGGEGAAGDLFEAVEQL